MRGIGSEKILGEKIALESCKEEKVQILEELG